MLRILDFVLKPKDFLFRIPIPLLPRFEFAKRHLLSQWRLGGSKTRNKKSSEARQEGL